MERIIAVGASMGGHAPLVRLLEGLPRDFPAAVLIVVHTPASSPGLLPRVLLRSSALPVSHALDGEIPRPGRVYVAPPDRHLIVEDGAMRVVLGPTHNGSRPAVDPLFRSVAAAYREGAVGVILSGLLDCGAAGLFAIRRAGGHAIVQDPESADAPDMPRHALKLVPDAEQVAIDDLARAVYAAVRRPARAAPAPATPHILEIAFEDIVLSCPQCGGPVQHREENGVNEYACRVGHAFTVIGLESHQGQALEGALWSAVRILDERVELSERLAARAKGLGNSMTERLFLGRAEEFRDKSQRVRGLLTSLPPERFPTEPG